jgi:hypothetical protein
MAISSHDLARVEERAEFLKRVADDAERGKLPAPGAGYEIKLALWTCQTIGADEPTRVLNAVLELGRQAKRALLEVAVRVGCDPERLVDPAQVQNGESMAWATLVAKLQERAVKPATPADDPTAYRPASELCPDKGVSWPPLAEVCESWLPHRRLDPRALRRDVCGVRRKVA